MHRHLVFLFSISLALSSHAAPTPREATAKGTAFFENKIRPVLVEHCYKCHSEAEGERKGGLLLEEAGMRLRKPPYEPKCDVYSMYASYLADPRNEAWRDYLTLNR